MGHAVDDAAGEAELLQGHVDHPALEAAGRDEHVIERGVGLHREPALGDGVSAAGDEHHVLVADGLGEHPGERAEAGADGHVHLAGGRGTIDVVGEEVRHQIHPRGPGAQRRHQLSQEQDLRVVGGGDDEGALELRGVEARRGAVDDAVLLRLIERMGRLAQLRGVSLRSLTDTLGIRGLNHG